jgi:hypothetical protein
MSDNTRYSRNVIWYWINNYIIIKHPRFIKGLLLNIQLQICHAYSGWEQRVQQKLQNIYMSILLSFSHLVSMLLTLYQNILGRISYTTLFKIIGTKYHFKWVNVPRTISFQNTWYMNNPFKKKIFSDVLWWKDKQAGKGNLVYQPHYENGGIIIVFS